MWGLAVLLRVLTITRNAIWYDELMNLKSSEVLTKALFQRSVHSLHVFILHLGLLADHGVFGLRLMPLLFGIASFPFVYATGKLIANRTGAIAFGLLFALSQYNIFYSQDGNYYAEMMFYAAAALYLTVAGLSQGRLWLIFLSIIPHSLAFLTHPFSAICFFWMAWATIILLFVFPFSRPRMIHLVSFWEHSLVTMGIEVVLVLLMAALNVIFYEQITRNELVFHALQMFRSALHGIGVGATSWNMEFNLYFFARTLRELGPSYIHGGVLSQIASVVYITLWALGIVCMIQRRRWLALLFYLPFIGTYWLLFNFNPERFFHIRYVSYLCPMYLAGVALGAIHLASLVKPRVSAREGSTGWLARVVALWPLVLVILLTLPSLTLYYLRDGGNWRTLAAYLQPKLTEDSRVLCYNDREFMQADFYAKRLGFPPATLVQPLHMGRRQEPIALAQIKSTVAAHPGSWFFNSWVETVPADVPSLLVSPVVTKWVRANFRKELDAPSAEEVNPIPYYKATLRAQHAGDPPVQSAVLYGWQYPDRYLFAPRALRIDLTKPEAAPDEAPQRKPLLETSRTTNSQSWRFPLLVETTGRYHIAVEGPKTLPAPGVLTVSGAAGEKGTRDFSGKDAEDFLNSRSSLEISEGRHDIVITYRPASPSASLAPLDLRAVTFTPDWEHGFHVPALNFSFIPQSETEAGESEGTPYLRFNGNRAVLYSFAVADSGRYQLMIDAKHDKPAPIIVEVRVDDTVKGILAFGDNNNKWGSAGFPLELGAGTHTLSLVMTNADHTLEPIKLEDKKRAFCLNGFSLKAIASTEGVDDRYDVNGDLFAPPAFLQNGFGSLIPGSTVLPGPPDDPWWLEDPVSILATGQAAIESPDASGRSPVVRLNGAPGRDAVNIRSAFFPVKPSQILYFTCRVRTENLYTHTANAQVWYFTADPPTVANYSRIDWVCTESFFGTQPWERWVYFNMVPENAKYALVTFDIFKQELPAWLQPGSAYFQDFEWCTPPGPEPSLAKGSGRSPSSMFPPKTPE